MFSLFGRSLSLSFSVCVCVLCSLWHHASRTILATHIHTLDMALRCLPSTAKHNIFSIKQIPMFINHPFIHPCHIHPPTLLLLRHAVTFNFIAHRFTIFHSGFVVLPCRCCRAAAAFSSLNVWFFVSLDCRSVFMVTSPHCASLRMVIHK